MHVRVITPFRSSWSVSAPSWLATAFRAPTGTLRLVSLGSALEQWAVRRPLGLLAQRDCARLAPRIRSAALNCLRGAVAPVACTGVLASLRQTVGEQLGEKTDG
jgi:hypothetical protein